MQWITREWFELYNPGTEDVLLNGLVISDMDGTETHRIVSSVPVVVPAEGYAVLGNNGNTATNAGQCGLPL